MGDNDAEDDKKDLNTDGNSSATDNKGQKTAGSGSGNEPPKGYVPEESYKGLQRVLDKQKTQLEDQVKSLQEKLDATSTQLEETKLEANKKADLERSQADLNTKLQTMQTERDQLARRLNMQNIVLAKFPDLAPLAAYIPPADTDEAFVQNATNFQNALKTFVTSSIQSKFAGATPPIDSGNGSGDGKISDELYDNAMKFAGIPGKEAEYQEAYQKYLDSMKTQ